jgi:hypothetical protein
MDNPQQSFEDTLRELKPCQLSPQLKERLRRSLSDASGNGTERSPIVRRSPLWMPAALALAALLLILAAAYLLRQHAAPAPFGPPPVQPGPTTAQHPPEPFRPVSVSTLLVSENDEGTVFVPGLGPTRRIRYQLVDTAEWRHPRRNMRLLRTEPREEVVFVKLDTD